MLKEQRGVIAYCSVIDLEGRKHDSSDLQESLKIHHSWQGNKYVSVRPSKGETDIRNALKA